MRGLWFGTTRPRDAYMGCASLNASNLPSGTIPMPTARLALLFALSLSFILWPRTAAAETFDTCVGFIDSVPATITAQGTWCMDGNLGTSISSGNAITVATHNV